jgi:hypothetical protein
VIANPWLLLQDPNKGRQHAASCNDCGSKLAKLPCCSLAHIPANQVYQNARKVFYGAEGLHSC